MLYPFQAIPTAAPPPTLVSFTPPNPPSSSPPSTISASTISAPVYTNLPALPHVGPSNSLGSMSDYGIPSSYPRSDVSSTSSANYPGYAYQYPRYAAYPYPSAYRSLAYRPPYMPMYAQPIMDAPTTTVAPMLPMPMSTVPMPSMSVPAMPMPLLFGYPNYPIPSPQPAAPVKSNPVFVRAPARQTLKKEPLEKKVRKPRSNSNGGKKGQKKQFECEFCSVAFSRMYVSPSHLPLTKLGLHCTFQ